MLGGRAGEITKRNEARVDGDVVNAMTASDTISLSCRYVLLPAVIVIWQLWLD